eukprot:m.178481 g.178481  ORF g.178481 m.178481 type:complete len:66 (-) comp53391_c0_seq13:2837-3034(-)
MPRQARRRQRLQQHRQHDHQRVNLPLAMRLRVDLAFPKLLLAASCSDAKRCLGVSNQPLFVRVSW